MLKSTPTPTTLTPPPTLASITNHETYNSEGIPSPASLNPNPLEQFSIWFKEAQGQ